ncbi:RdRP-domain-containing protein, partial [Thelephora ganbajun]
MDIQIRHIPDTADKWEVVRAISSVVHHQSFIEDLRKAEIQLINGNMPLECMNFDVELDMCENRGLRNKTTGNLLLCHRKIGDRFLQRTTTDLPVRVQGKKLKFHRKGGEMSTKKVDKARVLEKTRFIDPGIQEKRATVAFHLRDGFTTVRALHLGFILKEGNTKIFSSEFKLQKYGQLWIDYEQKLFRILLGEPEVDEVFWCIVITIDNLKGLGLGDDHGNPYVAFGLHAPPLFQREHYNRDRGPTAKRYRERLSALNPAHARVAPYVHQVIFYLHEHEAAHKIRDLCQWAGLARPTSMEIEIQSRNLFAQSQLDRLAKLLSRTDWKVAFQFESLLRNNLLHVGDVVYIHTNRLAPLYKRFEEDKECTDPHHSVAQILKHLTEQLKSRQQDESVSQCIDRVMMAPKKTSFDPIVGKMAAGGTFLCHHVTFTPTRLMLEGPYITQSNRVIRQFPGFEHYFVRVDFRDESRTRFRWSPDTNGRPILEERVGNILKWGFNLGGRHLEFLAYSSSALRQHAVWFMIPFERDGRLVNAESIRKSLGDFSQDETKPAKMAARMAQAFTATNPSITLVRGEWEDMDDLGEKPHLFTDGVGTISKELGSRIWKALCEERQNRENALEPSAYQIRFLGYKGVVAIDEQLEGIKMRLRPSMKKFKVPNAESAEIEIVQPFGYPINAYLNRQLIVVLEDRKVAADVFLKIQDDALARITGAQDSIDTACKFLQANGLGWGFGLRYVLDQLGKLGLDLKTRPEMARIDDDDKWLLNNNFMLNTLKFAEFHVLRDIKHRARIPVGDSHVLVGVADEGPEYRKRGIKKINEQKIYSLTPGNVYVCIQERDKPEPRYIEGPCLISRNPVVHPGDVQQVNAIGPPPEGCLFGHLKNVVVFPSLGDRSLPSMLGGGDLDGDIYAVMQYKPLLSVISWTPAEYPDVAVLDLKRRCTVEDVCNFVVNYIDSDILGLLADRHLTIADQSAYGILDPACETLAELCSKSVDFSKNGVPVPKEKCPRPLLPYKPDWHAAEVLAPRETDYYESPRALGQLYRAVPLKSPPQRAKEEFVDPDKDNITFALRPKVLEVIPDLCVVEETKEDEIYEIFEHYQDELSYICSTHVITNQPGARLTEEEIVTGTIVAKASPLEFDYFRQLIGSLQSTEPKWRNERVYRMNLNSSALVHETRRRLTQGWKRSENIGMIEAMKKAWRAWMYSVRNRMQFGANTFGLIALAIIFDGLNDLAS